jgi:hypothetical protein
MHIPHTADPTKTLGTVNLPSLRPILSAAVSRKP